VATYERLEREAARPKRVVDHREAFERLVLVADVNGPAGDRIAFFCEQKRISVRSLVELGTRAIVEPNGGGVALVFGHPARVNGKTIISAVKYRPLDDGKKRYAAEPSVFLEPLVIGRRDALDWFLAEGETDACRIFELIGDVAAVMVLPAGALTFKRKWAAGIPRGATVYVCHDADEAGDKGAEKAARIVGGRTVRVRPPVDGGDWCDWDGDRQAFIELVGAARASVERNYLFQPMPGFLAHTYPPAEPLLGTPGEIFLAVGSLLLVYGAEGTGKSTLTVDAIAHLAAGSDWLEIPVPRPVRVLVVENEGPPSLFQQKLADKAATWDGPDWTHNVYVYQSPWGEFTFADSDARQALADYCDEHSIDVVTANPTLGLGVAASGRPDETQQFVDWLTECGLKSTRAFWLLHHENKAGQISGDWGRHPDTKVQLQADGNRPRTKLVWEKTRWATLPSDERPKAVMLEWVVETKGYRVVELDTAGASNEELEQRIVDHLSEHPLSSTRNVQENVKGTNSRISDLLRTSPRFDSIAGPNNATLWLISSETADAPNECVGDVPRRADAPESNPA
jgi:hypothetical protein